MLNWYFLLIFVSWQLISCQRQSGLVLGQSSRQSLALTSIVRLRPWPCPRLARPRHNTDTHTHTHTHDHCKYSAHLERAC